MTDKFTQYNAALGLLGERRIASLSEAREPRRVLDDFWQIAFDTAMEAGLWKFAKRVVETTASTTLTPGFGYLFAFPIPEDWVRTIYASTSPYMQPPLLDFAEEAGYWYTNWSPLFVSYISNDAEYGGNLGGWSRAFANYQAAELALAAAPRITNNNQEIINRLCDEAGRGIVRNLRIRARATDAMNDAPGFAPQSSWVRARWNYADLVGGQGGGGP